jgi:hypothetical protein
MLLIKWVGSKSLPYIMEEEPMVKITSLLLIVGALVLGSSLLVGEANATNDKGQLVAMCRSMVDKKGVKDDQRRAEVQKCMRDVSSYK